MARGWLIIITVEFPVGRQGLDILFRRGENIRLATRANIFWLTSSATREGKMPFGSSAQLGGLRVDQMMHPAGPGPEKKNQEPPANRVASVNMLREIKLFHWWPGAGVVFGRGVELTFRKKESRHGVVSRS